jgi:hypothetical protein
MKKYLIVIIFILTIICIYLFINRTQGNSHKEIINTQEIINEESILKPKEIGESTMENKNNPQKMTSLENIETFLFIKKIYQKEEKWWVDVDYAQQLGWTDYFRFLIDSDICKIPGMNKEEMKLYTDEFVGSSFGVEGTLVKDNGKLLVGNCGDKYKNNPPDMPSDFGEIINQSPKIRSFPFSVNYKTLNFCPKEKQLTIPEITKMSLETPYRYNNVLDTVGFYVSRVVIKNSEITELDFINGCAG